MKSRTLVWIAAITLFAALALPVPLPAQRTNGLIAYSQITADGPANVFIANPDGSNVQQVPLPPDDPAETFGVPVWSPDGTKLLISHTFRCDNFGNCFFQPAIVDPSGSNFNQLVPPNPPGASSEGMDCEAWFPGGTRILCAFSANPNAGVFSINASDGGDGVRLTTNPFSATGGMDFPTDVSLDGSLFLFVRTRFKRNPNDTSPDQQPALFIENTDGTGLRQLTASGKLTFGLPQAARFSPDGTQIIGEIGNGKMFTIHPDGSHYTDINLQVTDRYFAFGPAWSPDGTRIIFCMFINGGEGIYTANPDGSNVKQVTFTTNLGANFANVFNGPNWGTHPLSQ
jgi:Tol biopolymer transport system component